MWDMQKVLQALVDVWAEYNCPDLEFEVTVTPKDSATEKGHETCQAQ